MGNLLNKSWGLMPGRPARTSPGGFIYFPAGIVQSDAELWDMMAENICACGYEGRAGIHMDVAADSYFDRETHTYRGLFDSKTRTREELMDYLVEICHDYPFVSYEDPLNEDDYEGHAVLTERTGIQIVGDDLFTTNTERVRAGIAHGSCNAVLLKVNQIGTITEALSMVRLAQENGYGVMPCSSRGEDLAICDYSVGMNVTTIRENCFGTGANRFLEIERELGGRAVFAGKAGLKGRRFSGRTEGV
jgi:enolase